jgi:hypothetical protein
MGMLSYVACRAREVGEVGLDPYAAGNMGLFCWGVVGAVFAVCTAGVGVRVVSKA